MSSSVNEQLAPSSKPRISPLEYRNTDLVSRLLAATPPYLYNMSLLPNTYFFSEMLRSFVQAKSETTRTFQQRRTRKRPWSALKPDTTPPKRDQNPDWLLKSSFPERKQNESPLELTTDNEKIKNPFGDRKVDMGLTDTMYNHVAPDNNPGLILPPPPPIWYPPLYTTGPPYGIDPLHFFIDLRVSGQMDDRKNQDNKSEDEKSVKDLGFKPSRHASAFSVPTPRVNRPINLSHTESYQDQNRNNKFDVKSMGFDKTTNKTGTSYVLNNIGNIYKNISEEANNGDVSEEEKKKKVKDLRALIGLELVVDYMNHAKPQPRRLFEDNGEENLQSAESPTLEVVALQDET